jgi:phosphoglucosamine mutase
VSNGSTTPRQGLRIAIDCANGAGYRVAPTTLYELGAEVFPIGVNPDGLNINAECGSTYPMALAAAVRNHGADIGIALDGDADRLIICDEHGKVVDGDQIMALVARDWARRGLLTGGGIVATVMSNLGLERGLLADGLTLERTRVGDRYVMERMRSGGFNLGGEQSGHIILHDYATTGDGLMSALQVLAVMVESGRKMSDLARQFEPVPQLLQNVRYSAGKPLETAAVKAVMADGEARLAGTGRLLVRKSGTEKLIRVMAEGDDPVLVESVVLDIVAAIEAVG